MNQIIKPITNIIVKKVIMIQSFGQTKAIAQIIMNVQAIKFNISNMKDSILHIYLLVKRGVMK